MTFVWTDAESETDNVTCFVENEAGFVKKMTILIDCKYISFLNVLYKVRANLFKQFSI